jgi:hypothetical protein
MLFIYVYYLLKFRYVSILQDHLQGVYHTRGNFYIKMGSMSKKMNVIRIWETRFIPGYGFIESTNGIFMFVISRIDGPILHSLVRPRFFLHNYKGHQELAFTNWTSRGNNRANAT